MDAQQPVPTTRPLGMTRQQETNWRCHTMAATRDRDEAREYIAEGCPGWGDLLGFSVVSRQRMRAWVENDCHIRKAS